MNSERIPWTYVSKKRLSWMSEMLQLEGTSKSAFHESIGLNFELKNAQMAAFHEFLDTREISALHDLLMQLHSSEPGSLQEIVRLCYQRCGEFSQIGDSIAGIDWAAQTINQLQVKLAAFHQAALRMIPVVYFEPDLSRPIAEAVTPRLEELGMHARLPECLLALTSSSTELLILREHRDMLSLAAAIISYRQTQKSTTQDRDDFWDSLPDSLMTGIKTHVANYAWINTDDIYGSPWSTNDVLGRLRFLTTKDCRSKLEAAVSRQKERELLFEQLTQLIPLRGPIASLVGVARTVAHLRTHRTEVYVKVMHQARRLVIAAGRKIGISDDDTKFISLPEMLVALTENLPFNHAILDKRKESMSYQMLDRVVTEYSGKDTLPEDLQEAMRSLDDAEQSGDIVKGVAACLGEARGVCNIVRTIADLQKFRDGDVLVAPMTIPEFVPAMEKACAFVTDEGGITCHAAIISRELGIPCLIGTGNATRVFKDGDFIEVNASAGYAALR